MLIRSSVNIARLQKGTFSAAVSWNGMLPVNEKPEQGCHTILHPLLHQEDFHFDV